MRTVWEDLAIPGYLDATAKELLIEVRTTYDRLGLRGSSAARHDGQLLLFPWVGDRKYWALLIALTLTEFEPEPMGIALTIPGHHEGKLVATLTELAKGPPLDPMALASLIANKEVEKFDPLLGDDLLTVAWATDRIESQAVGYETGDSERK
jgi:ATP-dependent Lhr-like helicase